MEPGDQRKESRHPHRVFRGTPQKTDLLSRSFLSVQAWYGVNRLNRDGQRRTANIVYRQPELLSY